MMKHIIQSITLRILFHISNQCSLSNVTNIMKMYNEAKPMGHRNQPRWNKTTAGTGPTAYSSCLYINKLSLPNDRFMATTQDSNHIDNPIRTLSQVGTCSIHHVNHSIYLSPMLPLFL